MPINPFSFAPFSFDEFFTQSYEPTTIPTEPAPPISISSSMNDRDNITQRIADSLAGDRYYGITPEDKDRALSMALMEMGGRLGAAAGAGSWTKAYPYLNQMMSSGYGAYNQSLQEDEKRRMAIQDRIDQLKLREINMKKATTESEALDREEAAKATLRASAEENATKWRNLFKETVLDTDITDPERKVFNTNFEFAIQNYMARPDDPAALNTVLDYVNKVGAAAGQTEKIDQTVANELYGQWKKEAPNIPYDKWVEDQQKLYGLSLTKSQLEISKLRAQIDTEKKQGNYAQAQADYYAAGKPGSGSSGDVTESKQYTTILGALNDLSKTEFLMNSMTELMDPDVTDKEIVERMKSSPEMLAMIGSFFPTNQGGQPIINKRTFSEVFQTVFSPVKREQFAKNYASGGLPTAPTMGNIKVAGVDASGDPKIALRAQKFLQSLINKGYKTVDGKPLDRATALAKLQSMTPDQIERLDKELGL